MPDYKPLTIKRTFKAPQQKLWDAWTKPEEFKQWFMPLPFTTPRAELDVRVGGKIDVDNQGPNGNVMRMTGEYKEVDEPNKLVMVNSPLGPDGQKLFEVRQTVELSEANGQTEMQVTSEVLQAGPEAKQFLDGMEQGLNIALEQMDKLVTA